MKRNPIVTKLEHKIVRPFMIHYLDRIAPMYFVTEHPKSGGSWVSQMLADYLNVPFPRNKLPPLKSCVMHGHYLPSDLRKDMGRIFVVVRDGRDVMVSWYYHCFFINDRDNERLVRRMRRYLSFDDYNDIRANLPEFIQFHFSDKRPFGFSWLDFTNAWIVGEQLPYYIKYERLLENGVEELGRAIHVVLREQPDVSRLSRIIDKYSFKNLSGRTQGDEQKASFLRKGIVGDWKNHFSKESEELFDQYAGEELIRLGYEKDRSWVGQG